MGERLLRNLSRRVEPIHQCTHLTLSQGQLLDEVMGWRDMYADGQNRYLKFQEGVTESNSCDHPLGVGIQSGKHLTAAQGKTCDAESTYSQSVHSSMKHVLTSV